jgi:hypothetical protein
VVDGDTDKAGDRVQDRFVNLDQRGVGGCRSLYIEASRTAGVGTHHSETASRHGRVWYGVRCACGVVRYLCAFAACIHPMLPKPLGRTSRFKMDGLTSLPTIPSQSQPETTRQPASPPIVRGVVWSVHGNIPHPPGRHPVLVRKYLYWGPTTETWAGSSCCTMSCGRVRRNHRCVVVRRGPTEVAGRWNKGRRRWWGINEEGGARGIEGHLQKSPSRSGCSKGGIPSWLSEEEGREGGVVDHLRGVAPGGRGRG